MEFFAFPPEAAAVQRGTLLTGGVAHLFADDQDYLQVRSVRRSGLWLTEWSASTHITVDPQNILELSIAFDGHYDFEVIQDLLLYNFSTDQWDLIDTRPMGAQDETAAFSTDDFGFYVGDGGEVRVSVQAQHLFRRFVSSGDFIQFGVTAGGGLRFDSFPTDLQVDRGVHLAGGLGNLVADDGVYLGIDPVRREGRWRTDWFGTAIVTRPQTQIVRLMVTYDGGYSADSSRQDVFVFDFDALQWVLVDSRGPIFGDETIEWATANFGPYISAGGEVRVRVRTEGALRYVALADLMRVRVQLFPPDIEVVPLLFEETVVQGTVVDRTMTIANEGFSDLAFEITDRVPVPPETTILLEPDPVMVPSQEPGADMAPRSGTVPDEVALRVVASRGGVVPAGAPRVAILANFDPICALNETTSAADMATTLLNNGIDAAVVRADAIDTMDEILQYDAIVIGNTGCIGSFGDGTPIDSGYSLVQDEIRAFVEVHGRGVVATGWIVFAMYWGEVAHGIDYTDYKAILPVDVSDSNGAVGQTEVLITDPGHPISLGVADYDPGPTSHEYANAGPRAGTDVVAPYASNSREAVVAWASGPRVAYLGSVYLGAPENHTQQHPLRRPRQRAAPGQLRPLDGGRWRRCPLAGRDPNRRRGASRRQPGRPREGRLRGPGAGHP